MIFGSPAFLTTRILEITRIAHCVDNSARLTPKPSNKGLKRKYANTQTTIFFVYKN